VNRKVVIFGGTGFLGRRVVRHLLDHGYAVRVASRHPERGKSTFSTDRPQLELIRADIGEDLAIRDAVTYAFAAVNAVSLYVERGNQTFHSVHVEAAERLARHSREAGIARLVHVSGIGADPASPSPYIRSRGEGESAVRAAFSRTESRWFSRSSEGSDDHPNNDPIPHRLCRLGQVSEVNRTSSQICAVVPPWHLLALVC
jgi:nucleoside-diphosphate-sugar epimerase